MDFFTLFSPDGAMVETSVVCIVIALMFLYTFVGICAGFGGGLTTMPLVTLMLPVKMATPLSGDCRHRDRLVRHLAVT
ncbi:putative permease [Escherichia coli]|uniref:Putative permease n=1 Tax=Escherichia coli TaxID=562 RepID=A0A376JRB2_ECOLX|nr:putative permease [Escherichia coli]